MEKRTSQGAASMFLCVLSPFPLAPSQARLYHMQRLFTPAAPCAALYNIPLLHSHFFLARIAACMRTFWQQFAWCRLPGLPTLISCTCGVK